MAILIRKALKVSLTNIRYNKGIQILFLGDFTNAW